MATVAHVKKLFWGNESKDSVDVSVVKEKNGQIGEQTYVDGVPIYQDGNGAPVETVSPLGYHVGYAGILFLNVSQMVGTGVFSTRKKLEGKVESLKLMQLRSGRNPPSIRFRWSKHSVLDLRVHHRGRQVVPQTHISSY